LFFQNVEGLEVGLRRVGDEVISQDLMTLELTEDMSMMGSYGGLGLRL